MNHNPQLFYPTSDVEMSLKCFLVGAVIFIFSKMKPLLEPFDLLQYGWAVLSTQLEKLKPKQFPIPVTKHYRDKKK